MKLTALTPMFLTNELEETIDFYVNIIGFKCEAFEKEWGWAMLSMDNVNIMIAKPLKNEVFEAPKFTGSIYLFPDNVDEAWEMLKNKAKVSYPIENFDYGMREFAIYDNNGYLLQFGQEIEENQVQK
ncbi:VOC family protein [Fulvivirgaceae bacterium BMA10]|uniref:VOC family protein n=1 Tax=Splendidivirga corallicola TaxID=3051826 RepID=A0ABT8KJ39_9BACT|nr:VOC family protein [Fulvivirgaceae bacterium BMA10]